MLNLTEVVKRQNPKSKKGFNQVRSPSPHGHLLGRHSGRVRAPRCVHVCMHVCKRRGVRGLWGALWVGGEAG